MDYLFLTRFLHRAYPDGRIVILAQDMLLRREVDTSEFRGVMSLSTYPLMPRDAHWSAVGQGSPSEATAHAHRVFESHIAEGTYLAARYSIAPARDPVPAALNQAGTIDKPEDLQRKPGIAAYADPFWMGDREASTHPPTWLTVIGRDGFWPVAVLNETSTSRSSCPGCAESAHPQGQSTMPTLHRSACVNKVTDSQLGLPTSWKIAALLILVTTVYQLVGLWPRSESFSTGMFAVFRPARIPAHQLVLGINSAFAAILSLEVLGLNLPLGGLGVLTPGTLLVVVLGWSVPCLSLLGMCALLRWRQDYSWQGLLAAFAPAGLIFGFWYHAFLNGCGKEADSIPYFYRSTFLTSGVSPLLPLLFITCGFYLWTWQALAGSQALGEGRPQLPAINGQSTRTHWRDGFMGLRPVWDGNEILVRLGAMTENRLVWVAHPFGLPLKVLIPTLGVLVGMLVAFDLRPLLLSLEGDRYDGIINIALGFGLLLTISEATRLWFTWTELRRLLQALSRTRLRRTFSRLRAVPTSSLWAVSGQLQTVQHAFFAQQWDAVRRLHDFGSLKDPAVEDAFEAGRQIQQVQLKNYESGIDWAMPRSEWMTPSPTADPRSIRDIFNVLALYLLEKLWEAWQHDGTALTLDTSESCHESDPDHTPCMHLSSYEDVRLAEEFICYHYISFIQNILARMRTMMLSMICLFVAVCLAISFYPFVPRTQITVWMMINLAVIASVVISVYANMERDETLSYITNTTPGKLGFDFWVKSASFLAGPVLGLLTTQFPAISDSFLSWVQPAVDAFK